MRKLLVIVRREYIQRVRTKAFLITTLLLPLFVVGSAVVPGLLFSLKSGGATRLAVVDETGKLYESVRDAIQNSRDEDEDGNKAPAQPQMPARGMPDANNEAQMRQMGKAMGQRFEIEQVQPEGRTVEQLRSELDGRVRRKELDAYLILPANVLAPEGKAEYRARNLGDVITTAQIKHALRRTVIEERMREANVDPARVRELSKEIEMDALPPGAVGKDTGASFGLALGVGLFTYMIILLYGQMLLSSVVEEKTTRVSEVLFSSVKPFQLMAGKLIGVSLAGLTQLAIWLVAFAIFAAYGAAALAASGMKFQLPHVPAVFFVCAVLYFLVGFFMFGTIYVLVGSMVTSEKEAGQMAMPVIFLSVVSICLAFPIIRSPNSPLAFWVSISPFFSPVTMLVRVVTETPPLWQIALSLAVGVATTVVLTWVAARIYRVGMLMYGKSASLPEVLRWVRQA
ncbi:MAG: ABC transporter permease [Pyrinomonadaceae bacterium]